MSGFIFGALLIIMYLIWSYDCIKDMIEASKMDRSIHSSTGWWWVITLLGIIFAIIIIKN